MLLSLFGMQSKYILLISATKLNENLPYIAHFLVFCARIVCFVLCFIALELFVLACFYVCLFDKFLNYFCMYKI